MDGRILIAYASKAGSTLEVAQAIGEQLRNQGVTVDVRPAKSVASLDGYQAVVIGSAVYYGKWLPEALDFLSRHAPAMARLSTAFFTLHLQAIDDSEESRTKRRSYADAARQILVPAAEGYFSGKVDPGRLSFLDRMAIKLVKAPIGDFRDWDAIHAWAGQLQSVLRT